MKEAAMTSTAHTCALGPTLSASRRRFVCTTVGGVIFAALPLAGCSPVAAVPDSAVAAWFPDASRDDPRRRALSWAILAPNPHNRQPWLIDLTKPDEITVRIDTTRLLPETDPFGRQILIGTGAMLGLLEIAATSIGYRTETHLFEQGAYGEHLDSRPLARIRLAAHDDKAAVSNAAELFAQIPKRRTVRLPYDPARTTDARFSKDLGQDLSLAAGASIRANTSVRAGVITRNQDPRSADSIARIAKAAWKIELTTPRLVMESVNLMRVGSAEIDKYRDGITMDSFMLVALDKFGLLDRSKAPTPASSITQRQIADFDASIDSSPAFFWLTTVGNSRHEQVEAGIAYARAQLRATAHGMVMHPLSQSLQEYEEMIELRRDIHREIAAIAAMPTGQSNHEPRGETRAAGSGDADRTLQMLCRIGYLPNGVAMPGPAPRRGLEAHIRPERQA
ncbi:MAG: twin-arginine translocation pathway signal protein [Burkholderiales bacterium]